MVKIASMSEEEHAALVGRVTIAWNDIQFEVFQLFTATSGMPRPVGLNHFTAPLANVASNVAPERYQVDADRQTTDPPQLPRYLSGDMKN